MAKAPPPGEVAREREKKPAERYVEITMKVPVTNKKGRAIPETHQLFPAAVPIKELAIFEKATGKSLEEAMQSPGVLQLVRLWWLARRVNGESFLTFDQAMDQWPVGIDVSDDDQFVIEYDDGEDEEDGDEPREQTPEG